MQKHKKHSPFGRQIARNVRFYKYFFRISSHWHTYILANMACPAGRPALDPVSDLVIVVWEGPYKKIRFTCFYWFHKHFP